MSKNLLTDIRRYPNIFIFHHPISPQRLDSRLVKRHVQMPNDLKMLWLKVGGGDLFETETLLAPYGDETLGDDIDSVNRFYLARGMPSNYLIFHYGWGLSVVRLSDGQYARLDEDTFAETSAYQSLDDWYLKVIRAEYASRYGLG